MATMRNDGDAPVRRRRGPRAYRVAPGESVDVHPLDVERLASAGLTVVEGTSDGDGGGTPPLAERGVDELRRVAQELDISGRSTMTKAELVSAIDDAQE